MPTLEFSKQPGPAVTADAVAVFATKDGDRAVPTADATAFGEAIGVDLAAELSGIRFDGELGAVARIPTRGKAAAPVLLVVGLGNGDGMNLETLRKAAGAAARNAAKDSTLAVVVPGDVPADTDEARGQVVAEGAALGAYAFTRYRSKPHDVPAVEKVLFLAGNGMDAKGLRAGLAVGDVYSRATALARDLVNEPPSAKRPPALADRVTGIAKGSGLKVEVLDEKQLEKGGFGGLIGVGKGSDAPPRLVVLTHDPRGAKRHVVLAGKGITFDSGGLSLKPPKSMQTMKLDMAGAAAVVGAMSALEALDVKVKVTGLLALAENMPSGHAQRVSDVITHRGGKTVEVMNTDAEGRLVLADMLAYGAESSPDAMIDLATLTGAQVVALGNRISAVLGTDDDLVARLEAAAEAAGERIWRLPLPEDYAEQLKSEVADLKNIGKPGQAGTIIGALFLKEFAGDVAWAHLDIAGPSFSDEGDSFYTAKGGTGVAVRLLARFLQDYAQPD